MFYIINTGTKPAFNPLNERHKMTKFQTKQVEMIRVYLANDMQDTAARSLSALVRSARRIKDKKDLIRLSYETELIMHPDYIV
jgi:phosphopantetheine adenylyltransferase